MKMQQIILQKDFIKKYTQYIDYLTYIMEYSRKYHSKLVFTKFIDDGRIVQNNSLHMQMIRFPSED